MLHIGLSRVRDEDMVALVEEALLPRFLAEPVSPVAGSLLEEVVRDRAHHGLVDLALEEAHRWLTAERAGVRRDRAGAGPLVVPVGGQRPGHPPAAPRGGGLGRRHPPATPTTTPAARWTARSSSSPTTCCTTRRPRSGWSGSRTGCSATPSCWSPRRRCGTPSAGRCWSPSRTPRGRCAGARVDELRSFGDRLSARRRAAGPAGPLRRRPGRSSPSGRYGDELTAVITHTIEPLGRQGGGPQDRAARRPRPAVHPDQRHRSSAAWSAC